MVRVQSYSNSLKWIMMFGMMLIISLLLIFLLYFYKMHNEQIFPIKKIKIHAPFRYVSELDVQQALLDYNINKYGFFSLNLTKIQEKLSQNPWVKDINVYRTWPETIEISFDEGKPLADWYGNGIMISQSCMVAQLNDSIKVDNLPIIVGNKKKSKKLCDTLEIFAHMVNDIDIGIKKLAVSNRGSWYLELSNGLVVLLGKDDIEHKFYRFVKFYNFSVSKNLIAPNSAENDMEITYVDMRYSSGLALGKTARNDITNIMEITQIAGT